MFVIKIENEISDSLLPKKADIRILRRFVAGELSFPPHKAKILLNDQELLLTYPLADLANPEQPIVDRQLKFITTSNDGRILETNFTIRKINDNNCENLNFYSSNFVGLDTQKDAIKQFHQVVTQCNIVQVAGTLEQDQLMITKLISSNIYRDCFEVIIMPKTLINLAQLYQAFFNLNKMTNETALNAHFNFGLSIILKIMMELNTIKPYPFKDQGTYGQLKAMIGYTYLDEIEEGLSTADKIKRYQEILDMTHDLNDHPEESKTLRGFILGTGDTLNEQGYVEYSYNETVNTQFDAIRHGLIKKQTFSQDKSSRYISRDVLMTGFFSFVMMRIQELKLEATLKIQKKIKQFNLSSELSANVEKIENSHKLIKDFMHDYESARTKIADQDAYQKQRINFVIEKAGKYEQAVRIDERFQTAKNASLVFFKEGKVKETLSYLKHAHEQLVDSDDYKNFL